MMDTLPNSIKQLIYEFDNTYRVRYDTVMAELKQQLIIDIRFYSTPSDIVNICTDIVVGQVSQKIVMTYVSTNCVICGGQNESKRVHKNTCARCYKHDLNNLTYFGIVCCFDRVLF